MRSISTLCLFSLFIAGCAATANGGTHNRHQPGVLRWGLVGLADVPTLDPALASDPASISLSSMVYGGLVRLDNRLRVRPDGAARWTISGNGRIYTFFLRRHLRFADGRAVTASDFARALRRSLGSEGSAGTGSFYLQLITRTTSVIRGRSRTIRGIDVINASTLRITLRHAAAHFLAELAFPASYVPEPRLQDRYGPSWTDHAAGFGPYAVEIWRHSQYLTLVRNAYYYGGTPTFRRISLRFYLQQEPAIAAYRRGALDLVSGLPVGEAIPDRAAGTRQVPGLALDYLAFNTARLPFKPLNVRRAFAAAWIAGRKSKPIDSAAYPTDNLLPSGLGITSPPWLPRRRAGTYLFNAGYPRFKSFPQIQLVMPRDAHLYSLARKLSRSWHTALGIDVVLRELNPSNYSIVLNARAFDLALVRWGADYPDPQDFLGTQLGSSSDNITGWSAPGYNRSISLADSYDPNDPRRTALFRQAAALVAPEVPYLPLDEPAVAAIIDPHLKGVQLTPLGTITGAWTRARFIG